MEYHLSTTGGTFSDYIFNPENEAKVKEALGESNVVLDRDAKTITYKGTLYQVGTDGGVTKLDGIGLSESQKELTIVGSEKGQFSLTATLTNITGTITWTSSNPNVATISGSGNTVTVIAAGAGTTTITASCSGKEATCNVTVKQVTKTTSMKLDKETATVEQGSQIEIKVSQKDGTDDIIWEVLDSSGNSTSDKAVVAVKEGTNGATVVVTGKAKGTVKIKAKTKYYETGASCTLEITEPSYVGAYFDYNVAYTDAYDSTKTYTNLTGWRILSKEDNSDGTSNIKIISTGIPALLQYSNGSVTSATWAETDEAKRIEYVKAYDATVTNSLTEDEIKTKANVANVYAAAGLKNKFGLIKFEQKTSSLTGNKGGYAAISKNGVAQSGEIDGNVFITNEVKGKATVRSVMHTDVPDVPAKNSSVSTMQNGTSGKSGTSNDTTGLFKLSKLGYSSGWYWLASPYPGYTYGVCFVGYDGYVGNGLSGRTYGVRPVVSISGIKVKQSTENSGVWEMNE